MKRSQIIWMGVITAGALFGVEQAAGQRGGDWRSPRNDAGHAGVQKAETLMTKEKIAAGQVKLLWKMKLGSEAGDSKSYSEPLLLPGQITARGFKDYVIWGDQQNVYAVDSELGAMLWTKHYDVAPSACGVSNLSTVMEAPVVINFGARRAPGAPLPPPQPPPPPPSERRVGAAAGGGGFGLKGLFVLTPDGYLHEQVATTGVDFAPAVKFLPGAVGVAKGLGLGGKTLYTVTSAECKGGENALYAIDFNSGSYPVASYETKSVPLEVALGPTLGDGDAYVVTGKGASDVAAGVYANSVVALGPDAKVKDWYTPGGEVGNVTPVAFTYKEKKLLAAPGKDGSVVLLDAASLGGADHKTALGETAPLNGKSDGPGALAVWQDAAGAAWVFASVNAAHGSVTAFKIEENGGKMALTPQWTSSDLMNPAPPVIANGIVVELAQGSASANAKLVLLDATTGKELYSSGSAIPTYAHNAGVAFGDGHVFFVTHDNTLYSFGIGIEH